MDDVVFDEQGYEEVCPYLPDRLARMHHRLIPNCSTEHYERLLARGWRRFGSLFFRPTCRGCMACRSLRVEIESFAPSRSMRRTRAGNQDIEVTVARPVLDLECLALFHRYHRHQTVHKGWASKKTSAPDYYMSFVEGHGEHGWEMRMRLDGRLVAVTLFDRLSSAMSAVYTYYEPELRDRGLGVFAVLELIDMAKRRGLPYLYLGYWIEENASMRYKAQYRPHQILSGRPHEHDAPIWRHSDERAR